MDVKSGHETRDTGLFGDYWWANRFLNHHRQIEALNGKPVDLVMLGDSITHFWEWHWKSWAKFTKDLTVFNFGYRGERMHHDRTFYVLDGDCIGLVSKGDVPWEKNRLWLDLLANSGTALFVSWKRELMDDDVRAALTEACRKASGVQPVAEPLDWMQRVQPTHWRFGDTEKFYNSNGLIKVK